MKPKKNITRSKLARKTLVLVLAGGRGSRQVELTDWRAKPAVPFGANFRIIDFALSNCINSGLHRIGILTQYKAHSLIRHIMDGWSWFRASQGEFVEVLPASQRTGDSWYMGTADAVYQNLDIIRNHGPTYVLILPADHVYKMDFTELIARHAETGADFTVSTILAPIADAKRLSVVDVSEDGRIVGFTSKPDQPQPVRQRAGFARTSMGIYVFNSECLYEELIRDADQPDSHHDFAKNVIPQAIGRRCAMAFSFGDSVSGEPFYWRDVGTLDAYWRANMELTQEDSKVDFWDPEWPVFNQGNGLAPNKFILGEEDRESVITESLVSGGCQITGSRITRSVLFANVTVGSRCTISDTLLLPKVTIGRNCEMRNAVIDQGCNIPDGTTIGVDHEADQTRGFRITDGGIVLVTPSMLEQKDHYFR